MKVYVICGLELGWDSVIGVYSTEEKALDAVKEMGYTSKQDAWDNLVITTEHTVE